MKREQKWWVRNPELWKEWVELCKEIGYPVDEKEREWAPFDLRPFLAHLHSKLRRHAKETTK